MLRALSKHLGADHDLYLGCVQQFLPIPLQKLQQELQAELSSGKISSGDQDALSSALTDIDSSLQADRSSQSSGSRPSPDEMKSKIDDLISAQVSSGKLTSDQATELQGVFQSAFADGGPGGAGGPKGAGGPPPAALRRRIAPIVPTAPMIRTVRPVSPIS